MDTGSLIRRLAEDAVPVKLLPHPAARAVQWLALSLAYVAAIVLAYRWSGGGVTLIYDGRFVFEEMATTVTAVTAAIAAFCCIVPGRDRRIALLPILPLAAWLASVGKGCISQWAQAGAAGLDLRVGWECLPASALIGVIPAVAMVAMLRRGAPLYPRSTIALGALAAAAMGNLGLRLFHAGDVTIMMLVWHLGTVALLLALAGWLGPRLLLWESPGTARHTN